VDADIERRLCDALDAMTEVRLALLFGSQAGGGGGPLSDVDVAVLFDAALDRPKRFRASLEAAAVLASALGRDDVDLICLNDAPPLLRQEILKGGSLLLCRDPSDLVRLRVQTLRDYVAASRLLATARPYLANRLQEKTGGIEGNPPDQAE
jgi:predicted nucleotidyltransferase